LPKSYFFCSPSFCSRLKAPTVPTLVAPLSFNTCNQFIFCCSAAFLEYFVVRSDIDMGIAKLWIEMLRLQ
jgi:hypothetical protein